MPNRRDKIRCILVLIASVAPLLLAGCDEKKVVAAVPAAAPVAPDVRPMTIAPDTDATPPLEAAAVAPSLPAPSVTTPPSSAITTTQVAPPPRRPTTAPSPSETADADSAEKPQPPRIVLEISPGDQAAAQHRVDDDSAIAAKNLQTISGRQLNAAQQDLADKVRSFLAQSTDAGKGGDWTRAQNLAQKARVLSIELINSL
jgi:hypothetical protein